MPCAGFRQCGSTKGTTGLNPAAKGWDGPCRTNQPAAALFHLLARAPRADAAPVHPLPANALYVGSGGALTSPPCHLFLVCPAAVPMELRCATNDNLTEWGEPIFIYPVQCRKERQPAFLWLN